MELAAFMIIEIVATMVQFCKLTMEKLKSKLKYMHFSNELGMAKLSIFL